MPRQSLCRTCRAPVHRFTETGISVAVDVEPLSVLINLDAPHYRHRLWHYLGPRVGWAPLYDHRRTWRAVHAEHRCPPRPPAGDALPAAHPQHDNELKASA